MATLQQLHNKLRLHFKTLSDERDPKPVFFLEHELTAPELDTLTRALQDVLPREPFCQSDYWNSRHLPMLVLAAEVGYAYGGLGSDYWPLLEERLQTKLNEEAKAALELYFEQFANLTRTRPVETRRSEHFHRIAWPLAHAVLHKGLRITLAELVHETVLSMPLHGGETARAALVQALVERLRLRDDPSHQLLPRHPGLLELLTVAVLAEEPPSGGWLSQSLYYSLLKSPRAATNFLSCQFRERFC